MWNDKGRVWKMEEGTRKTGSKPRLRRVVGAAGCRGPGKNHQPIRRFVARTFFWHS
jgi:hypothetical protein